jgi:glycosyltransferase involved in cell wall biosynthesis
VKVALIHDWLNGMRGGEKVFEVLCDLFPDADAYTLFYESGLVSPTIRAMEVHPSVLQRFPFARRHYRLYLPFFPWAIGRFDLTGYDVVISSSHCAAKGVQLGKGQVHICYCHAPMRYIWDQYEAYFGGHNRWRLSSIGMSLLRGWLQRWDVKTAKRVDRFVANSRTVARRIERYYGRDDTVVVNPPINTDRFHVQDVKQGDYFLIVAALVPYKRIDQAVEAFSRMERPLYVVGDGPERQRLEQHAGPSVHFTGWIDSEELVKFYNGCQAFLFPGEEDFGITAVEAQACGRPVIGLRRGGVTESVVEGQTGIFYDDPTVESLCQAVARFDQTTFDRAVIREHAEKFGGNRCRRELDNAIGAVLEEHGIDKR